MSNNIFVLKFLRHAEPMRPPMFVAIALTAMQASAQPVIPAMPPPAPGYPGTLQGAPTSPPPGMSPAVPAPPPPGVTPSPWAPAAPYPPYTSQLPYPVPPGLGQSPIHPATPPPSDTPAKRALLLQVRLQGQAGFGVSAMLSPGFLVAYHSRPVAFGMGIALTRVNLSTKDDDSFTGTLFQLTPTVLWDVWRSRDGRTAFNAIGSLGFGRASFEISSPNRGDKTSGWLLPLLVGFGGDQYLSPYFAIGAELGFQTMFVVGVDSDYKSIHKGTVNYQAFYGLLRASILIGGF